MVGITRSKVILVDLEIFSIPQLANLLCLRIPAPSKGWSGGALNKTLEDTLNSGNDGNAGCRHLKRRPSPRSRKLSRLGFRI